MIYGDTRRGKVDKLFDFVTSSAQYDDSLTLFRYLSYYQRIIFWKIRPCCYPSGGNKKVFCK